MHSADNNSRPDRLHNKNSSTFTGLSTSCRGFLGWSLVVVLVLSFGVLGYHHVLGLSWLDSWYFTLSTIGTIGFAEPPGMNDNGRIFTIILIIMGLGVMGFALRKITHEVTIAGVREALEKRRDKRLKDIKDHYIVCGMGRMGSRLAQFMKDDGAHFIIIDSNYDRVTLAREKGYHVIEGDATQESTLMDAGIMSARGLLTVLGSDPENVYVVLTARSHRPNMYIASRANDVTAANALKRAGASKVINPIDVGAFNMAWAALKPAVNNFWEVALASGAFDLIFEGVNIGVGSKLIGQKIKDAPLRRDFNVIIIAIKR